MARPTQYSRDEVLEQAMNAFWNQGYCATGVAELGAITKLKPGSLYGAFESKQKLFMEALDRYGQESVEKIRNRVSEASSPIAAIRSLFHEMVVESSGVTGARSCLLVNTALEVARHDDVIRKQVNSYFNQIEAIFRRTLRKAQEQGELSQDKDIGALAAFLISNIWGLRVLGATKSSRQKAKLVVSQVLSVLD